METKKILIKLTTRSRVQKALNCLDNIYETIEDKDNYLILLTIDSDDETMFNKNTLEEIKNRILKGYKIAVSIGLSRSKIDAINRGLESFKDWDLIVSTSDDMLFVKYGWDNIMRKNLSEQYPDTDGCLHYNDGYTREKICTLSVIGRKYFDRFGYIYNPIYKSLWCDNEFTEIALNLGKIKYFDDILFKHYHPNNIGGFIDKQYIETESFNELDYNTYSTRKKETLNFTKI